MTPLQFEQAYQGGWDELQALVTQIRKRGAGRAATSIDGERLADLYRRACGHLALARDRAYPAYLVDSLEQLTADAHQLIYRQSELGFSRLKRLVAVDFPVAVRAHALYVWIALAAFAVPTLVLGVLVYYRPELVLTVLDSKSVASLDQMYSNAAQSLGRVGGAQTDWQMFGYYINNNIGIAFQCFAGGLFAGLGSLFFMAYNGALGGAVAGYLTEEGLAPTFFSFVVTHAAFELTAIVLAGAAGLRIGHALLAPGRRTRAESLVLAARQSIVIVYGVTVLLLVAAAIEAFWSSAPWIPLPLKYTIAGFCWLGVLGYLTLQGRHAS
jgi:uncharacterized membrane protein SpoIIM required for sporulation